MIWFCCLGLASGELVVTCTAEKPKNAPRNSHCVLNYVSADKTEKEELLKVDLTTSEDGNRPNDVVIFNHVSNPKVAPGTVSFDILGAAMAAEFECGKAKGAKKTVEVT